MSYKSEFLSKYGSPKHLDRMTTSPDESDRLAIAQKHPDRHGKMLDDPSERVRKNISYTTTDKGHLDHMMHDASSDVRGNVARHGHKDHLDKLVHDKDWYVRERVASHGHKEHADKLVSDPDPSVRYQVANQGHHHDKLVHDESSLVRQTVAESGNEHHRAALANDPDVNIRMTVAKRSENRDTLNHLQKDAHPDVSRHARRHAADLGY